MKRITLNLINAELAKLGVKERLVRGRGYFYFVDGDALSWNSSSVYVSRLASLSLTQWLNERCRLARNR